MARIAKNIPETDETAAEKRARKNAYERDRLAKKRAAAIVGNATPLVEMPTVEQVDNRVEHDLIAEAALRGVSPEQFAEIANRCEHGRARIWTVLQGFAVGSNGAAFDALASVGKIVEQVAEQGDSERQVDVKTSLDDVAAILDGVDSAKVALADEIGAAVAKGAAPMLRDPVDNEKRLAAHYDDYPAALAAAEGWKLKNFRVARVASDGKVPAHYVIYQTLDAKPVSKRADAKAAKRAAIIVARSKIDADRIAARAKRDLAKTEKALAKPAKATKSDEPTPPRAGTRNEIIVAHLTRDEGATKGEIDAALLAFQPDKKANCGIKSDAKLFGARFNLKVVETADADGTARFRLVKDA